MIYIVINSDFIKQFYYLLHNMNTLYNKNIQDPTYMCSTQREYPRPNIYVFNSTRISKTQHICVQLNENIQDPTYMCST